MQPNISFTLEVKEFQQFDLIFAAAETEDEIGTVLRIHLAVEQVLVWYINQKRTQELAPYLKESREFGSKLSMAAVLGLPLAFVRVIHQINSIRNKLAHGTSSMSADQVKELIRQVEKLTEIDSSFIELKKRFVELPLKRPGEKIVFGENGARYDFLIATMAFYETITRWAANQLNAKYKMPTIRPGYAKKRVKIPTLRLYF